MARAGVFFALSTTIREYCLKSTAPDLPERLFFLAAILNCPAH
jgi:hypothetical protein